MEVINASTPAVQRPAGRRGAAVYRTRAVVAGTGVALPARSLGNDELAVALGVTPAWIESRCGVTTRFVAEAETTSSLAVTAARQAMRRVTDPPDMLLCATFTPDFPMCPVAPTIAHQLRLPLSVAAVDVNGACAGGLTALLMALDLIRAGAARSILVLSSDTTTKFLDPGDRATRILFGDGAAALLLSAAGPDARDLRILARIQGCDGAGASLFRHRDGAVQMDGPALFRFAVETGTRLVADLVERSGRRPTDVARVILHQANARILATISARTAIPRSRWTSNVSVVGNLASASVLFALAEVLESGNAPAPGDTVLVASFGAGLVWAGAVLEF